MFVMFVMFVTQFVMEDIALHFDGMFVFFGDVLERLITTVFVCLCVAHCTVCLSSIYIFRLPFGTLNFSYLILVLHI